MILTMAKQKAGGLRKRLRTAAESSAQRSRSFRNKAKQRKAHARKYPNDTKSLSSVLRWTDESQRSQKSTSGPKLITTNENTKSKK